MQSFARVLFSGLMVLGLTAFLGSAAQAGGDQPQPPIQQQQTPCPTPSPKGPVCPQQQKPYQSPSDQVPYQPKAPR